MARGKARPDRRIHELCRQLNVAVARGQDKVAYVLAATIVKQRRKTSAHLRAAFSYETLQFIEKSPLSAYL